MLISGLLTRMCRTSATRTSADALATKAVLHPRISLRIPPLNVGWGRRPKSRESNPAYSSPDLATEPESNRPSEPRLLAFFVFNSTVCRNFWRSRYNCRLPRLKHYGWLRIKRS